MTDAWKTVGRPGFFGSTRDDKTRLYNETYGEGNWRVVWEVKDPMGRPHFYEFERAIMLYEEAYWRAFVGEDSYLSLEDVAQFEEVYDNNKTNVLSGIDYSKQEGKSNHYQDISIRRCLTRACMYFRGTRKELLHVRHNSHQQLGRDLSPGRVLFHDVEQIKYPPLKGWWEMGTIECFWQSNKTLQVREGVQPKPPQGIEIAHAELPKPKWTKCEKCGEDTPINKTGQSLCAKCEPPKMEGK